MFSTNTESADPLSDGARAEHFVRGLPRADAVVAQKKVCQALADFCAKEVQDRTRLRALVTLDVRVRPLLDGLLVNFLPGNPQPREVEAPSWQAAFELVRALGGAHAHALRSIRDSLMSTCREHLPLILLRLFEHRRMELLLRPFVDERSTRFPWKELHDAYKLARSCGALYQSFPVTRPLDQHSTETTIDREYLLVLLQDLVNGAQVPPQDAFWAARRFSSWSQPMKLGQEGVGSSQYRFGVDLDGDGGPARVAQESGDSWRYFDTALAVKAIDREIASLRDGTRADDDPLLRRGRRLRLLRKLSEIAKPERVVTARRGERTPVALTVEVVVGMARIVRALRSKPDEGVVQPRPPRAHQDEMFTTTGGFTEMQTGMFAGSGGTRPPPSGPLETPHPPLTMVDRSDSGCRLHGATHPLNPIVPGMLIAFRDASSASWSIGVVRRTRKRMAGKRVELGVEFVGRDARRVIVIPDAGEQRPDQREPQTDDRFAAIYLPESANYPALPMKTLILPSRGLKADDRLSVRSRSSVHTIVLKEAFEEQADFLWSPFDIVDRWLRDDGKSGAAAPPR